MQQNNTGTQPPALLKDRHLLTFGVIAAVCITIYWFVSERYHHIGEFHEERAILSKLNGKYGFIDTHGNEVIPFEYDHAGDFENGLAKVMLNYKFGFIDKNGNVVFPLIYDKI